jgi:hypothetical protein
MNIDYFNKNITKAKKIMTKVHSSVGSLVGTKVRVNDSCVEWYSNNYDDLSRLPNGKVLKDYDYLNTMHVMKKRPIGTVTEAWMDEDGITLRVVFKFTRKGSKAILSKLIDISFVEDANVT